ncbi:hypothetical protein I4I73_27250 [Pseudonocardia sp. KRD-184]|uniref:Fatty acid desaturase n=1 Tax=Pseudonocardia oceani TaxID=2792013 RepID=A0ABS6UE51_9PSEU|nr:hypothetical protein [Pseudonocardia oceani]MBW0093212.1 hypothetical protein [Pseudonocardia oceani]MBW0099690.1 hypothetical protein [Pseudonocardia oceani]MBW0112376.1 hypothetical protein [Pseudonocardia oceani]MBW0125643.1 hypothetical protein [Pseudonocardia oceani]MBW0130522.1 hypothetical protein [Pseudonocardia oceani]
MAADPRGRDPWARQDALARSTTAWGAASVVAGLGLAAARRGPFATAFGTQNAGWGAVDLVIVVVAGRLKRRRMARLPDPYADDALAAESRTLRRVLWANVVLDAGYVAGGAALWRWRRDRPGAAGASAGIVVQGAFLLLHDAHHAYWSGRR